MCSQETHMKKTYIREYRMKKYTQRVQNSKATPATLPLLYILVICTDKKKNKYFAPALY